MRIVILGAGAVGGYFGGRLIEAGADVTFVVRPRRLKQLQSDGLVIESPLGNARLNVNAVCDATELPPADIVVLAPKAYDLGSALDAIAPVVANGTAIVPLLNGVAHLDVIATRFPSAKPWGGVAHIGAMLTDGGVVKHLNRINRILFGPRQGVTDHRAAALQALFSATPAEAAARPAIEQDLWDKLVFLATLAGATCLFRASIGTILATPDGGRTMEALLDECAQVATAEGFIPTPTELDRYRGELQRPNSPLTASMLRDLEKGATVERAHILGDLLQRARRHSLETPVLAIANSHVAAYEIRKAAEHASAETKKAG